MQDYDGLEFSRAGGVATITLNRPEKLNAILHTMVQGITEIVDELGRDDDIRAIVITGAGRAFSSGDDIVGGMGQRAERWQDVGLNRDLGPHHHMVKTRAKLRHAAVARKKRADEQRDGQPEQQYRQHGGEKPRPRSRNVAEAEIG